MVQTACFAFTDKDKVAELLETSKLKRLIFILKQKWAWY